MGVPGEQGFADLRGSPDKERLQGFATGASSAKVAVYELWRAPDDDKKHGPVQIGANPSLNRPR